MANYRNISMAFWTDSKVEDDFTPEDKYAYFWCLTNPHTNMCGCYEVSIKQMAHETGYNTETAIRLLKRLDNDHNVVRYDSNTKELLVLNWWRYNWSTSEKLNKPLLAEIRCVKSDAFREYLAGLYNNRETVTEPYESELDTGRKDTWDNAPPATPAQEKPRARVVPEEKVPRRYGEYHWVRLTDEQYQRLLEDLGEQELLRCITYIDEAAQSNGNKNKWKDWNLVIRKCSRNGWGLGRGQPVRQSPSAGAAEDLRTLHEIFSEDGS